MKNGFKLPSLQLMSLRDLILQINAQLSRVPDLGYVIVMGRQGDLDNMACMSNVDRESKIAMLTKTRDDLAAGKTGTALVLPSI